jgi:hypothetical protein
MPLQSSPYSEHSVSHSIGDLAGLATREQAISESYSAPHPQSCPKPTEPCGSQASFNSLLGVRLTAPEPINMANLVAIASELTGREINRITVPYGKWPENMVSHGAPAPQADLLVGLFQAARRGDFAAVDPTLETLLGPRPQTMRDVLAATLKD